MTQWVTSGDILTIYKRYHPGAESCPVGDLLADKVNSIIYSATGGASDGVTGTTATLLNGCAAELAEAVVSDSEGELAMQSESVGDWSRTYSGGVTLTHMTDYILRRWLGSSGLICCWG